MVNSSNCGLEKLREASWMVVVRLGLLALVVVRLELLALSPSCLVMVRLGLPAPCPGSPLCAAAPLPATARRTGSWQPG